MLCVTHVASIEPLLPCCADVTRVVHLSLLVEVEPYDPLFYRASETALLVMDYQNYIATALGLASAEWTTLVNRAESVVAAARAANLHVIYVVVEIRDGQLEIAARHKSFSRYKGFNPVPAGSEQAAIIPQLKPQPNDAIVVKRRVSAFYGTDLDILLSAMRVSSVVLFGVSTSGVVLSTVRHGSDRDLVLTVVEDCCYDRQPDVHRALMGHVFANQAHVMSATDTIVMIGKLQP